MGFPTRTGTSDGCPRGLDASAQVSSQDSESPCSSSLEVLRLVVEFVAQPWPTLQPHGLQPTRRLCPCGILQWVAISSSRGSSQPRDQTWGPCTAGRFFTTEPPGKPYRGYTDHQKLHIFGNSLMVQWLGLCTSTARGPGSIPRQGIKISQCSRHIQKMLYIFKVHNPIHLSTVKYSPQVHQHIHFFTPLPLPFLFV